MNAKNNPYLIKVDLKDRETGTGTKADCHSRPVLHRAFSVFLYVDGKMLIQQRAQGKYHSGGLWTNACCSHPRPGESLAEAVQSRLFEELGISCGCEERFQFVYFHKFREELYEYELDHVFTGRYEGPLSINEEEAMAVKWVPFEELEQDVMEHPERYTVWFITALPKVLKLLEEEEE